MAKRNVNVSKDRKDVADVVVEATASVVTAEMTDEQILGKGEAINADNIATVELDERAKELGITRIVARPAGPNQPDFVIGNVQVHFSPEASAMSPARGISIMKSQRPNGGFYLGLPYYKYKNREGKDQKAHYIQFTSQEVYDYVLLTATRHVAKMAKAAQPAAK